MIDQVSPFFHLTSQFFYSFSCWKIDIVRLKSLPSSPIGLIRCQLQTGSSSMTHWNWVVPHLSTIPKINHCAEQFQPNCGQIKPKMRANHRDHTWHLPHSTLRFSSQLNYRVDQKASNLCHRTRISTRILIITRPKFEPLILSVSPESLRPSAAASWAAKWCKKYVRMETGVCGWQKIYTEGVRKLQWKGRGREWKWGDMDGNRKRTQTTFAHRLNTRQISIISVIVVVLSGLASIL